MDRQPRLTIFTRPLCHECQTLKGRMGVEGDEVKQVLDDVVVYTIPPGNVPRNKMEVEAFAELDWWITPPVVFPVAATPWADAKTPGRIFRGLDEILGVWREGR